MWNQTGIHWRDIENPEFRDLARDAAYESYPELMDAERQHDGSIDAYFLSTAANIRLRSVQGEVVSVFTSGDCISLAWAIHQLTGLPIAVFTTAGVEDSEWTGHVAIQVGEDQFLDITGIRTAASIRSDFRNLNPAHEIMSDELFLARLVDEEYRTDLLSMYLPLESYIVEDFAEFLVAEHITSVPVN